jgi:hypothetical protein
MRRIPHLLLLLAIAAGLSAAARTAQAAWPHDPVNGGVPVCVAPGSANVLVTLADGNGGAFVAWQDSRNGALDIYAQHVSAYGVPLWTAGGVAVCTAANTQENAALALDGSGGLLLSWDDFRSGVSYDIYAQRLNAAGAPQWPVNGVALCTAALTQYGPAMVSDGSGGAVVAWQDSRNGVDYDIYARRVLANGTPTWTADGVAVCVTTGGQLGVKAVTDNAGGAIFAWQDSRSGPTSDVYAQRVTSGGGAYWTANGIVVCNATGDQNEVAMCPDGSSGALVSWTDTRSGNRDIYVQRVWYPGIGVWTANGVPLCTAAGDQRYPDIEPDGTGGGIAAWADNRAGYFGPAAQRVNQTGTPVWAANGVLLSPGFSLQQTSVRAAADGLGGIVVSWLDSRTGSSTDTYVQRLDAGGAAKWLAGGVGVGLNPQQDNEAAVSGDGAGGAIVVWNDYRNINTTGDDLFAARVDVFGVMGGEPAVASVKDVPNDQGGQVRVSWAASPLDLDPASYAVSSYLLFRSAPSSLVASALRAGRVTNSLAGFGSDEGAAAPLYAQPLGAQVYYWEYVGQQAAYHLSSYSMVTPTTGDSIGGSNPVSVFMVQARNANGTQWWSSNPDSGYSVDNLAPLAPAPFTGQYASGTAALHWNPNTEADLAGYELYRGTSAAFVPGPGNLVAAVADTGYADAAGAPYVYKILAVDAHGNRSPVATLTPSGTLGVDGGAAAVSFLGAPSPNPVRDGTSFAFGLARGGAARLAIYDAQGRRVRVLLAGTVEAGEHRLAWDGRDDAGRAAAPGLYLARLEAPGFAATRRLVVTQ